MLGRYIYLFHHAARRYENQENNYYVVPHSRLLNHVKRSFVFSAMIGFFALATILLPPFMCFVFELFAISFFIYTSIELLNYSSKFLYQDPLLFSEDEEEETLLLSKSKKNAITNRELSERINRWLNHKKYLDEDFTIKVMADDLKSNRTYISSYINQQENKTFREWVASLRIEEAKRLFMLYPKITVTEVGVKVGYPDRSNFNRQFTKHTGMSPKEWRKQSYCSS